MAVTIWAVALSFGTTLSLFLHWLNRDGKHPTVGKVADAVDQAESIGKDLAPKA